MWIVKPVRTGNWDKVFFFPYIDSVTKLVNSAGIILII